MIKKKNKQDNNSFICVWVMINCNRNKTFNNCINKMKLIVLIIYIEQYTSIM